MYNAGGEKACKCVLFILFNANLKIGQKKFSNPAVSYLIESLEFQNSLCSSKKSFNL